MRRIEICGGIASGKTTLCSLMMQAGMNAVFENFHQNPFWALFYQNPQRHAFETEVTFLLQHYCQVKVAPADHKRIVCDFSFLQDHAYAAVNLNGSRFDAFCAVYREVMSELSTPSLIVHLQCSAEEELARIRRRGRVEEQEVHINYLDELNHAVIRSVTGAAQSSPVLKIDSANNDFATDRRVQERLLGAVFDLIVSQ